MKSNTAELIKTKDVSEMAEHLIGSEIIKLAGEINQRVKKGEQIYNFTIGDFDPKIFPIPHELEEEIILAYQLKQTNYPAANGIEILRNAVSEFIEKYLGLQYLPNAYLIAGGGRPLIYATYITLLDKGDKVIYPIPSWNNNHYTHLSAAQKIEIETKVENDFMPVASEIAPHISDATLIALCSPLNPTGTAFDKNILEEICDLVIEENIKRKNIKKPLYILYDQLYWTLTFGDTKHFNPVSLRPELKDYVIFIDGISKAFASTGVRVGWAFGPDKIIDKMKSILSHIGAWAPKAEQVATANFLKNTHAVERFSIKFRNEIQQRLDGFYNALIQLKNLNFPVDCIKPQSAIYLTIKIDLRNWMKDDGTILLTMSDVALYILEEAKIGLVPFYAFGSSHESPWFRLSVGTCKLKDIQMSMLSLENALRKLRK